MRAHMHACTRLHIQVLAHIRPCKLPTNRIGSEHLSDMHTRVHLYVLLCTHKHTHTHTHITRRDFIHTHMQCQPTSIMYTQPRIVHISHAWRLETHSSMPIFTMHACMTAHCANHTHMHTRDSGWQARTHDTYAGMQQCATYRVEIMRMCMRACISVRTYVCMYACMHACMYMYACMCVCT